MNEPLMTQPPAKQLAVKQPPLKEPPMKEPPMILYRVLRWTMSFYFRARTYLSSRADWLARTRYCPVGGT